MKISDKLYEQLRAIDTPTLSNAIEKLELRARTSGFSNCNLRCLMPEMGVMCGRAVTAHVETMSDKPGGLDEVHIELCRAVEAAGEPTVVVLQEMGPHPDFSVHCGEVMATTFQRLGSVGLVSDCAVRDILEVRSLGFRYFARGLAASHGNFRLVRIQQPVVICGLPIDPGDLLHGDANGLLKVPPAAADKLPALAEQIRQAEGKVLDCVRGDDFTIDALAKLMVH